MIRVRLPWHRHDAVRRDYAIRGYLAEHGPCPAEDVAKKLHYRLDGIQVDLAVLKAVWKVVESNWEDDVYARMAQTMPARPPYPKTPRRRVYWFVPRGQRGNDSTRGGGAFWDDLDRRLEDPEFRKGYVEHFLRIQAIDEQANASATKHGDDDD